MAPSFEETLYYLGQTGCPSVREVLKSHEAGDNSYIPIQLMNKRNQNNRCAATAYYFHERDNAPGPPRSSAVVVVSSLSNFYLLILRNLKSDQEYSQYINN